MQYATRPHSISSEKAAWGTDRSGKYSGDTASHHMRHSHLKPPVLGTAAAGQTKRVKEAAARVAVVHGLELAALSKPVVLGSGVLEVH